MGPLGQWRDGERGAGERADRWARGAGRHARAEGGGRAGWPGPSAVWERARGRVWESDVGCGAKQAGARALAGEREGAGRCGLVERPRKGNAGAGRAVVWAVRGERSGRQGKREPLGFAGGSGPEGERGRRMGRAGF